MQNLLFIYYLRNSSTPVILTLKVPCQLLSVNQPRPRPNTFHREVDVHFPVLIAPLPPLVVGVLRPYNIWGHIRMCTDLWQCAHSAAPLWNQTFCTMTQYPTQSHYPDIELTSPCPILLMSSARLGSNKYKFDKSLIWLDWEPNTPISHTRGLHSTNLALCLFLPYHHRPGAVAESVEHWSQVLEIVGSNPWSSQTNDL